MLQTTRLQSHDYGAPGNYFVTICTKDGIPYLSSLDAVSHENDTRPLITLSRVGEIASHCWNDIPRFFPNVSTDAFIVMPNHIHGIITIHRRFVRADDCLREHHTKPAPVIDHKYPGNKFGPQSGNLASIIRGFKSAVTMRTLREGLEFYWHARYYDRVIRDESELENVRRYILDNPIRAIEKRLARKW